MQRGLTRLAKGDDSQQGPQRPPGAIARLKYPYANDHANEAHRAGGVGESRDLHSAVAKPLGDRSSAGPGQATQTQAKYGG